MSKINILPKEIAQLIAAGEVVERPASVVKELLENAIDAGAKRVTLEIRGGGIREIRITDDGGGILREDVRSAFLQHATSKVFSAEDLDAIRTLGFRGEALASISAVSRVELLTHSSDEETGLRYLIEGGEEILLEDAGCPVGTTIIIRDLFYNTPARMKFLKKDVSEANAVAGVVDRLALSHPEISFRFVREDKQVLFSSGDGDLLNAVRAVFGKDFASSLIFADNEEGGVRVHGYISKPCSCRATRSLQIFFLNGRFVKTATGAAALNESYKGRVMVGKHPACVLNIELPEHLTDVNVHPAKLEVRFADERKIFHAVYTAAKFALEKNENDSSLNKTYSGNLLGYSGLGESSSTPLPPFNQAGDSVFPISIKASPEQLSRIDSAREKAQPSPDDDLEGIIFEECAPASEAIAEPELPPQALIPAQSPRVLAELFSTYILIERGDELILLDKHAAHERIIYDQLKENNSERYAQQLLAPLPLTLSKEEYSALLEDEELLHQCGFEFTDFQGGTLLLTAAPMEFTVDEAPAALEEIAGELLKHRRDVLPEKLDWLYHSIACRAAVKAGDYTSEYERERFALKILESPNIKNCPHGRPVLLTLSRKEIERRFGRLG